MNINKKIN